MMSMVSEYLLTSGLLAVALVASASGFGFAQPAPRGWLFRSPSEAEGKALDGVLEGLGYLG
jgi:hypothetical protein